MIEEERDGSLSFGDRGGGSISERPELEHLLKPSSMPRTPLRCAHGQQLYISSTSVYHFASLITLDYHHFSVICDYCDSGSTPSADYNLDTISTGLLAFGGSGVLASLFDRLPVEMSASTRLARSGPSQQVLRNYGTG